jgi:acetyltransferase
MKRFFEPQTVALIGASANPARPGHNLFHNMNVGFGEAFYPVNPGLDEIEGRRCYPTILDVPGEVDLAVVFIPAAAVPEVVEQCARKGIRRVIIQSGGFAETGPEGRALQERCLAIGREHGVRLWGPNCMGLINVRQTKVLSFIRPDFWEGRFVKGTVSLVVQSGMLSAGFLAHILSRTPFGLSRIASIGNKMDVDEIDVLEYLLDDPDTAVVAMYLESIGRGRRFFDLCRATDKPVVALKAGRTSSGAEAAASHTASLAQNDTVLDAAFRQAGVIRVHGMTELLDVARSLAASPVRRAPGNRTAVITFSGGAGVVSSDSLADRGMELATLGKTAMRRLQAVFPDWMEPANPIDLYPAVEKNGPLRAFKESIEAVLDDDGVDAVFLHIFARHLRDTLPLEEIAAAVRERNKPMAVWVMGEAALVEETKRDFESVGIPAFDDIEKGVRILAALTVGR